MVGVANPTAWHPHLVDRAQGHSGDKRPPEAGLENQGILLHLGSQDEGPTRARIYSTSTPKSLNRNTFLPDELSYQDMWQQPALLTIAYARSLQYWAEKLSLLRSPDLHPLVGRVVKLWEAVREHVTFDHQDVVRGLGTTHLESTSHWPQTTIFSCMLSSPGEGQEFRKATTHGTSPIAEEDMAECATPPTKTERENPYLLVITASVGQLNLGPHGNNARRPTAEGNAFLSLKMVATFTAPTRVVCYGGATIKELYE